MEEKAKTGTKEWAAWNANLYEGCSYNCRYCYAKNMAHRFNRRDRNDWSRMELNYHMLDKSWRKREGICMFPSTHDITPATVEYSIDFLQNLLKAGNRVLIVTKADVNVIQRLITRITDFKSKAELEELKNRIEFRVTIGSMDDRVLNYWEPGAPTFASRRNAVRFLKEKGFRVSISIEPYLDPDSENVIKLIRNIYDDVSEIWIGMMNHNRKLAEKAEQGLIVNKGHAATMIIFIQNLKLEKIRWKDSMQKVIKKYGL